MGTPAMAATNRKESDTPGWLHRQGTSVLGTVARQACKQPIYTSVITALLATMTYTSLLEGSLQSAILTRPSESRLNQLDVTDFIQGSRSLRIGEATAWRWETEDESMSDQEVRPLFFCNPASNLLTSSSWLSRLHRIWL
jgi:hydroxymethylglutaryl-CoA reductase (NADPH)